MRDADFDDPLRILSRRAMADGWKQSAGPSDLASVLRIAEGKELNGRGYVSEHAALVREACLTRCGSAVCSGTPHKGSKCLIE
jgi:hypothetical protein